MLTAAVACSLPPATHTHTPQIDRADGSGADLASQLASQMSLGGQVDPRAPMRT